jgi:mannose-1-phosphate guanylyltransferase
MPDTSDEPVAVILAGGQGSRLWPISRDRAPKQFQPVVRDRPLLTGTIERLSEIVDPSRIHVSTRARFADAARATLGPVPPENLILEEEPAGPATAFALSIATLSHKYGNAPALIAPSDHLITEEDASTRRRATCSSSSARRPTPWWSWVRSRPASTRAWATSTPRAPTTPCR